MPRMKPKTKLSREEQTGDVQGCTSAVRAGMPKSGDVQGCTNVAGGMDAGSGDAATPHAR